MAPGSAGEVRLQVPLAIAGCVTPMIAALAMASSALIEPRGRGAMSVRGLLLPVALLVGLAAFFRAPHTGQFDDPEGDAAHILIEDEG